MDRFGLCLILTRQTGQVKKKMSDFDIDGSVWVMIYPNKTNESILVMFYFNKTNGTVKKYK